MSNTPLAEVFSYPVEDVPALEGYIASLREELSRSPRYAPLKGEIHLGDCFYRISEVDPNFHTCPNTSIHKNIFGFSRHDHFDNTLFEIGRKLARKSIPELKDCETIQVKRTATVHYPANGGYLGWHTNANDPGWRIYIVYVEKKGMSFFKYYDSEDDSVKISHDPEGFSYRIFEVPKIGAMKHCVYTNVPRWSFGLRITKGEPGGFGPGEPVEIAPKNDLQRF